MKIITELFEGNTAFSLYIPKGILDIELGFFQYGGFFLRFVINLFGMDFYFFVESICTETIGNHTEWGQFTSFLQIYNPTNGTIKSIFYKELELNDNIPNGII